MTHRFNCWRHILQTESSRWQQVDELWLRQNLLQVYRVKWLVHRQIRYDQAMAHRHSYIFHTEITGLLSINAYRFTSTRRSWNPTFSIFKLPWKLTLNVRIDLIYFMVVLYWLFCIDSINDQTFFSASRTFLMLLQGVNFSFIRYMSLERHFLLYYKGNLKICTIRKKTHSEHWTLELCDRRVNTQSP